LARVGAFFGAAFVAGLFINPPYRFAPEDNLAYARVVRMHLAGIAQLNKRYPGATTLSAWPVTDELTRPELGYLKQPDDVYRLQDFTARRSARPPRSRENTRPRWSSQPNTTALAGPQPGSEE